MGHSQVTVSTFYVASYTKRSKAPLNLLNDIYHTEPICMCTSVIEILSCRSAPLVCTLMEVWGRSPAYDFGTYSDARYRWELAVNGQQQSKRIIKF